MRPGLDFDETRTASPLLSQSGRSLLVDAGLAKGPFFSFFDVPGAYLRAPSNPNLRIVMAQPPRSNWRNIAPGRVCVIRRAVPGEKSANQFWDAWRDYCNNNWGLKKALAQPSMLVINTSNEVARMEADDDNYYCQLLLFRTWTG